MILFLENNLKCVENKEMSETKTDRKTVKVQVFGAIRQYLGEENYLLVETSEMGSSSDLKRAVIEKLSSMSMPKGITFDPELIFQSVVALEDRILTDQEKIPLESEILLFPPVCGG